MLFLLLFQDQMQSSTISAINRALDRSVFVAFHVRFGGDTRMRSLVIVAVFLTVTSTAISNDAFACGESMFRVGKGVHYRAYSAPIPGSVLVYARTDQERAVADQLQAAGHNVQVVSTDVELAMEMQSQQFDVVVAPYSKREAVEEQSAEIASHPDWVPVVESGSTDAKLAKAQYKHTVSIDDDIRKYLKAIHKSLKESGA
jgi:hypothetical protein